MSGRHHIDVENPAPGMQRMANFESFHRSMLPLKDEPHLTIHKRGTMSINRSAFELLGSPASVELLFDRDDGVIGLRAVAATADNAYDLRRSPTAVNGPWTVSAMAFTRFYDIDTTETLRWPCHLADGVLCVDISVPGQVVRSGRR